MTNEELLNKIKSNVNMVSGPKGDCWEWQKGLSSAGYGQVTINGKSKNVHKVMYVLHHGEVENKTVIRHKCHNRKCCNPDHLESGSYKDNFHDSYDTHMNARKKQRLTWIVNGVIYPNMRIACKILGMSHHTLRKYINRENQTFDYKAYLEGCEVANVVPKKLPTLKTLTKEQKKLIEDNM